MLFSYKTVITRVLEQHGSLAAALQSCYIYRYIHSYIHTYTHTYSSNNNNNNARTMFMVLSSWPIATTRVHPVHLTNVGQRRTAADPPTKPTDFGVESACIGCYMTYIHHRHLLLLSPKAVLILPSHGGWKAESTYAHSMQPYIVLYRTTLHMGTYSTYIRTDGTARHYIPASPTGERRG